MEFLRREVALRQDAKCPQAFKHKAGAVETAAALTGTEITLELLYNFASILLEKNHLKFT